jgi:hypothetical protein
MTMQAISTRSDTGTSAWQPGNFEQSTNLFDGIGVPNASEPFEGEESFESGPISAILIDVDPQFEQ